MQLPDEAVEDFRVRLRRAGGQVQAVETMLAEGRECRDIVTQLSAATKALEHVGFRLISSGLTFCLEHPEEAAESGYPLDEFQRLFTKLA
jgi:DNA-binding FrmR family transcriptional regulator